MWLFMAWLIPQTQTSTCPSPSHHVPQCEDSHLLLSDVWFIVTKSLLILLAHPTNQPTACTRAHPGRHTRPRTPRALPRSLESTAISESNHADAVLNLICLTALLHQNSLSAAQRSTLLQRAGTNQTEHFGRAWGAAVSRFNLSETTKSQNRGAKAVSTMFCLFSDKISSSILCMDFKMQCMRQYSTPRAVVDLASSATSKRKQKQLGHRFVSILMHQKLPTGYNDIAQGHRG
jgi:hypothetical protein